MAGMLAAALHLAAFAAVAPRLRGVQAAGEGGTAPVTLAAADPVLAALVADWDRPPVLEPPVPEPPVPEPPVPAQAEQQTPDSPAALTPAEPPVSPAPVTLPIPGPDLAPDRDLATPDPQPEPKPERRAKSAPQPAVPAQRAAGTGGKQAAGQSGTAQAADNGPGLASAKAEWGAAIRARIERRKSYPADADGAAGKVTLRLVVGADGRLASVSVLQSSGSAALDRAALRAVKAAGRFPKAPAGLGNSSFSLPISFAP